MKRILTRAAVAATACLFSFSVLAQPRMPGSTPSGMDAALAKLFGKNTAFTANAEVSISRGGGSPTMTMVMVSAFLDGKMRSEVDMSQAKGVELPPQAIEQMKQMGMGRVTSIIRPDRKTKLFLYPDMKSYVEEPLSADEASAFDKEPKIEKTTAGKETIDGHPCDKQKVVITNDKGEKQEVLVWSATDLKEFPVQMQMDAEGSTVTMRYTKIQLSKPDANLFDPPTGYTKYASQMEFMQKTMQKMMGGAGAPK